MAVRRRRPLIPPPYPRRNPYTPSSSQSPLGSVPAVSLRLSARTALAPLLLLSHKDLRIFACFGGRGRRRIAPLAVLHWRSALGLRWSCPYGGRSFHSFLDISMFPFIGPLPAIVKGSGVPLPSRFGGRLRSLPLGPPSLFINIAYLFPGMCYDLMTFRSGAPSGARSPIIVKSSRT